MRISLTFRGSIALAGFAAATAGPLLAQAPGPPVSILTDQGPAWTATTRKSFYSQDQGSRIMPLRWIAALKQPNGQPFMAASLGRYGYLINPESVPSGLPVGFTVASGNGPETIGMTCAACHARQIEVAGLAYRIDGGPAIVDFQSFLADLDAAVNTVLTDPTAFADFAQAVLAGAPADRKAQLKKDVGAWYLPFHTLLKGALPAQPWGPARLDAVSMIFNRLTGLDIGPPPTYVIEGNIKRADAPVRYPFLWNAPIQDKTQWPGFADNGNTILGLARNVGEVYGVFAAFHPEKSPWRPLGIDYLENNSANFHGLDTLEELIRKLGPPKWPWAVDQSLASQGAAIFALSKEKGGCAECHQITAGKTRFFNQKTWNTPIQDVGTDSREYDVLARSVQTGVLEGARIPLITDTLKPTDTAFNVLRTAVVGAILQHYVPILGAEMQGKTELQAPLSLEAEGLKGAFRKTDPAALVAGPNAYESRVLEGIWAAAPYLHNGSVPTLAMLLTPPAQRVKEFKVGPAYDVVNVGLAVEQSQFNFTLKTTDCSDRNSGNSRCGHDFGTALSASDKKALLEYLKSL